LAALALIAAKAQDRLHRRYRYLSRHGKRSTVAITAIARELAGFAWHVAHTARPT
jgi:transposase